MPPHQIDEGEETYQQQRKTKVLVGEVENQREAEITENIMKILEVDEGLILFQHQADPEVKHDHQKGEHDRVGEDCPPGHVVAALS